MFSLLELVTEQQNESSEPENMIFSQLPSAQYTIKSRPIFEIAETTKYETPQPTV